MSTSSPFLTPSSESTEGNLAILHLRRDQSIPAILTTRVQADQLSGYAEGNVVNTRFGSFPHTTLLNQKWGSQVRASVVDTGSRGRVSKKRKREDNDELEEPGEGREVKEAVAASSGFLHILPPTPENWTTSLPHRTQVVYTPDYSYILHRIRARPGSILIEAGSGSGSFTHAAARAVFNGYPAASKDTEPAAGAGRRPQRYGHVYSYEYHSERHKKVKEEMAEHGLSEIVTATHRDVYNDGFNINLEPPENASAKRSPGANAIFLDLPAPWLALPHLTRQSSPDSPSPLEPTKTVHICTFSPCIEQAQNTVSALRRHDWINIEMVEMAHKRIEIRREYTGLEYEGMRGANGVARVVEDAVDRLKEHEERAALYRGITNADGEVEADESLLKARERLRRPTEEEKREAMKLRERTLYKEGKLVHRTEPELKTHTSYLVFAALPREWSREDELKMRAKWEQVDDGAFEQQKSKSKKQMKREAKQRKKEKVEKAEKQEEGNGDEQGPNDSTVTDPA